MSLGIDMVYYIVADNYIIRFSEPPRHEKPLFRKVEPISDNLKLGKYLDMYI